MRCGFARIPLWREEDGPQELLGFRERLGKPSEGVHDVPQINTMVLGKKIGRFFGEWPAVAVISLDLCLLDHNWQKELRYKIKDRFGCESIIACTHTHAAPATAHTTFANVKEHFLGCLSGRVFECLQQAVNNLAPLEKVFLATTKYYGNVIMNRTFVDSAGFMHKGLNPNTPARVFGSGEDALPLDRDLNILRFEIEGGESVVMINFGCHPNVQRWKNLHISQDFPGALADFMERTTDMKAMFLNGVSGDVRPAIGDESWEAVEAFGAIMGGQVLSALQHETRVISDPTPWFSTVGFRVPLTDGATITAEMSCLAIGDISILTIPGEVYSSLGLQIKNGFEPRPIIVSYANGHLGYIPDRRCFEENHPYDIALGTWRGDGLYIPGYGTPTVEPKPEIGEIVVKTARELLTGMKGE